MTRTALQRFGLLAGTIALFIVFAWQGLGGRDETTTVAPQRMEQPRRDEGRPRDEGRTRDEGHTGDEGRTGDDGKRPAEKPGDSRAAPLELPPEVHEVLAMIARGGPFPYRQDGGVFQNREGRLPERPRGYYREYTVPTPGARDRGPRRIVTGGDPPTEHFYTSDHYRSLRPIEVAR